MCLPLKGPKVMEQLASLMFHGQGCDILVFSEATPDKNSRIHFEVFWAIYLLIFSQMLRNSLDGPDGQSLKAFCRKKTNS